MAHGLLIEHGKASMFYVGDPPWHGLGTPLHRPATAAEAIEAAGLDWRVVKAPLYLAGGHRLHQVSNTFAIVREDQIGSDHCPVLGMVGQQYEPLQNAEAFAFFDPIAGKGAAIYHTAGALGDGERVWILAKLPSTMRVVKDDTVDKYLLLSTSHDGSSAVQILFTPIRVVCQNTLGQALSKGRAMRVAHDARLRGGLREAQDLIGFATRQYAELEQAFQQMARVPLGRARLRSYLSDVFPSPTHPAPRTALELVDAKRTWAEYFFDEGEGNRMPGVAGTVWAAYNGVTEMIDHSGGDLIGPMAAARGRLPKATRPDARGGNAARPQSAPRWAHRRLESTWFGGGYQTKVRAFNAAVGLVNES